MAGTSDSASGENTAGSTPDPAPSGSSPETATDAPTAGTADTSAPAAGGTKSKPRAKRDAKEDKPARPEKPAKDPKGSKGAAAAAIKAAPAAIRTRVAQLVWVLCLIAALFLALGALVISLDFNQSNAAVEFVLNGADKVDLGVFTRDDGIKQFKGENAATKNALVNYGVGALFWIVVGRVADRFIRP